MAVNGRQRLVLGTRERLRPERCAMPVLPDLQHATFTDPSHIDNAFFPLPPGTINSYGVEVVGSETGEEDTAKAGARVTMQVRAGQSLGLFLIHEIEENGIDFEDFEEACSSATSPQATWRTSITATIRRPIAPVRRASSTG